MMKKIKWFMTVFCLCAGLFMGIDASAETMYVYDQADLLTADEEADLQSYAEIMKDVWKMNFVVVTTENAEGKSSMEYADDFYDSHFPEDDQEDGMLYLIDMDNQEIYLSTCGIAIRYLTDERISNVLDTAFEYVADSDYYGTFKAFFDESENYLLQGIPEGQYNYDSETGEIDYYQEPMKITLGEFVFAFLVALVPAAITVGIVKAKYQLKFEDFHYDAYTDAETQLSVKSDLLVNKFVTHRRIPKNDGSTTRSGSGGRSISSTHHSSSGRSHGGGGRKF